MAHGILHTFIPYSELCYWVVKINKLLALDMHKLKQGEVSLLFCEVITTVLA